MPSVFDKFPKARPALSSEYEEIYAEYYKENREGEGKASRLARIVDGWMHRIIASDLKDGIRQPSTLEIGAGTLNHLSYESGVTPYDIIEPMTFLYADSPAITRVRNKWKDISEVPPGNQYDRIVSIGTFEHICNLPEVVARCGLLLRPGGTLRIGIPNEGSLIWTLSWKLTTGFAFRRRYHLDYGKIMAHEHINTAKEIVEVLRYFFHTIEPHYLGVGQAASLLHVYICSDQDSDRCRMHLKEHAAQSEPA